MGIVRVGKNTIWVSKCPPAFQRYINKCLGDYAHKGYEPYLDDVLCSSPSFYEHLRYIQGVVRTLKAKGIKLPADKCNFFKKEVRY